MRKCVCVVFFKFSIEKHNAQKWASEQANKTNKRMSERCWSRRRLDLNANFWIPYLIVCHCVLLFILKTIFVVRVALFPVFVQHFAQIWLRSICFYYTRFGVCRSACFAFKLLSNWRFDRRLLGIRSNSISQLQMHFLFSFRLILLWHPNNLKCIEMGPKLLRGLGPDRTSTRWDSGAARRKQWANLHITVLHIDQSFNLITKPLNATPFQYTQWHGDTINCHTKNWISWRTTATASQTAIHETWSRNNTSDDNYRSKSDQSETHLHNCIFIDINCDEREREKNNHILNEIS